MRFNIYIPEELGNRIKKLKGKINLSEVAQQAFEQKLTEIAAAKGTKTMNDVIDRLRSSKKLSAKRKSGFDAGATWAKKSATYDELRSLEKLEDQLPGGADDLMDSEEGSVWSSADILIQALTNENYKRADRDIAGDFGLEDNDEFAAGFLDGALSIWKEVKGAL